MYAILIVRSDINMMREPKNQNPWQPHKKEGKGDGEEKAGGRRKAARSTCTPTLSRHKQQERIGLQTELNK